MTYKNFHPDLRSKICFINFISFHSFHFIHFITRKINSMPNGNLTWLSMIVTMKKLRNAHKSIQQLTLRFWKTQQWKGNPRKDIGLNTPIPSRNALENLSLNRNGKSGSPSTNSKWNDGYTQKCRGYSQYSAKLTDLYLCQHLSVDL